jgi:hypothetical protein
MKDRQRRGGGDRCCQMWCVVVGCAGVDHTVGHRWRGSDRQGAEGVGKRKQRLLW